MSAQFKFYKELIKYIKKTEESNKELKERNSITHSDICDIFVIYNGKEYTYKLVLDVSNTSNDATCILTKDGDILITLTERNFKQLMDDEHYHNILGVIAHEVGHILAGHFDTNTDLKHLSINHEKQNNFFIKANDNNKYESLYLNSIASSLIKGGVLVKELEADIIACELVGINIVLLGHALSFETSPTVVTKTEKTNRISELLRLYKDKKIKYIEGNKLELKINKQ